MTVEPATSESGNLIPMLKTLGIRLCEIGDRHAVMEASVSVQVTNQDGQLVAHGTASLMILGK